MEIRPILSALARSKVALVLIGLQIALTLAIVCNALFIINERLTLMQRPSGMNEADTFMIGSNGFGAGFDLRSSMSDDLAALRALPGVIDASPILTAPLTNGGWSEGISLQADQKQSTAPTAIYFVDEHGLNTYGAKLIAGRDFRADEITERDRSSQGWPPGVIITKALAERLFPGQDAIGKSFFLDTHQPASTVIGIVDKLQAPWVHNEKVLEFSTLIPQRWVSGTFVRYLIRAQPGQRDAVMKAVEAKLGAINPSRIVRGLRAMTKIRAEGYAEDRAMALILVIVIAALLTITALGIVGMASFWVTQRTKQIGTRRALGATRGMILRYFLTENFLITTLGLAAGALLAYGFNVWLIKNYEAAPLPWFYVAAGCIGLWLLGQLAVLGPARRAARVPPATATRSI